jgi:cytochrome P450
VRQPLLQAVFAETLRLRVDGFLIRCPSHEDLNINGYTIPRNHVLLTNSTPGHMDPAVWSAGENPDHPPHEFWTGRFLRHERTKGTLEFQLDGKEGSWMPFGGGNHICPGKRFAEYEIILTVALLTTMYDVELVMQEQVMKMSTHNFGFGTLSPKCKVPVRMRRRWT